MNNVKEYALLGGELVDVTSMYSSAEREAHSRYIDGLILSMSGDIQTLSMRYGAPLFENHNSLLDALNHLAFLADFGEASPVALLYHGKKLDGDRLSRLYFWRADRLFS